jgi:hypothetical protein
MEWETIRKSPIVVGGYADLFAEPRRLDRTRSVVTAVSRLEKNRRRDGYGTAGSVIQRLSPPLE